MPHSASHPILIAGGGIAGLALAIALARQGIAAHVLERRREFSEDGAGIQLGPNATRVLSALGLLDALVPLAARPEAIRVRDGASGRLLQSLPLGDWIETRHGAPYLVAHRRDLQQVLVAAARSQSLVQITMGFALERVEPAAGTVTAIADDGTSAAGAALVGADGVQSRLRSLLAPGSEPRFTGRTAARTVIPATALDDAAMSFTDVFLAPRSHLVLYPVRAGKEIAVVLIREEAWAEPGWSAPVDRDAIARALAPFRGGLAGPIMEAGTEWRRWALREAPPLTTWSHGPVTLIGDAAHPTLPFLAQGGALALEDALALADAIAGAPGDPAAAFRRWQGPRIERTAAVVRAAKRNGRIYHLAGLAARARNAALRLIPPGRVMAGYDWIYGWRSPG